MNRTIRLIRYLAILIFSIPATSLCAQVTVNINPSAIMKNTFGLPVAGQGAYPEGYLSLRAELIGYRGSIKDFSDGRTLFVQKKDRLPGWFPAARGDFVALSNTAGYIHIFGGSPSLLETSSGENLNFDVSIFDRGGRAWVNPAFFLKGIVDTQAPRILGLALEKNGVEFEFKDFKNSKRSFPQGRYAVRILVDDSSQKYSTSGVIRLKAMLDGMSALDCMLDTAKVNYDGFSFLGHQAPSLNAFDAKARLVVGSVNLLRGEHTLELFAYDFVGNEALISWKILVE